MGALRLSAAFPFSLGWLEAETLEKDTITIGSSNLKAFTGHINVKDTSTIVKCHSFNNHGKERIAANQ